jgi:flagellar biosynthesis anti-sigma factor FlgM
MINGIQTSVLPELKQLKPSGIIIGEPMARSRAVSFNDRATPNPAADLAAAGPPIDTGKVATILASLADGSFQIDAGAIAGRMVDLDLPQPQ